MKKFIHKIASDQNVRRLSLIGTILMFLLFYDRAGRHKQRALSGDLLVHVEHLESGNDFITTEEMRDRVKKKFQSEYTNVPMSRLSPLEMEASLKSLDFIKTADVYVDGNNRLNVYVTQREPVFRLLTPDGHSFYVDHDGTTMPSSMHYSPRVLVVFASVSVMKDTLTISKPGKEKDIYQFAHRIVDDKILNALIEEIIVDERGEWTLIPKLGPSRIYLGNLDRLEEKITALKRVFKEILPVEGWEKYYSINLKYNGQVICSKRA